MSNNTPAVCPPSGPNFDPAFRNSLLQLLQWRRDVRRFRDISLDPEVVDHLLKVACLAPSVGLSEPWRFVKVDDPKRRKAIRENFTACNADALAIQAAGSSGLYAELKLAGLDQAPCHLAMFALPNPSQGRGLGRMTMPDTTTYSAVMAIHTLWLAARADGIGLGWVSILNPTVVTTVLEVPMEWRFVGYLCLGYPQMEDNVPELQRAGWEQRSTPEATWLQR